MPRLQNIFGAVPRGLGAGLKRVSNVFNEDREDSQNEITDDGKYAPPPHAATVSNGNENTLAKSNAPGIRPRYSDPIRQAESDYVDTGRGRSFGDILRSALTGLSQGYEAGGGQSLGATLAGGLAGGVGAAASPTKGREFVFENTIQPRLEREQQRKAAQAAQQRKAELDQAELGVKQSTARKNDAESANYGSQIEERTNENRRKNATFKIDQRKKLADIEKVFSDLETGKLTRAETEARTKKLENDIKLDNDLAPAKKTEALARIALIRAQAAAAGRSNREGQKPLTTNQGFEADNTISKLVGDYKLYDEDVYGTNRNSDATKRNESYAKMKATREEIRGRLINRFRTEGATQQQADRAAQEQLRQWGLTEGK
jgi:hypothetical protein